MTTQGRTPRQTTGFLNKQHVEILDHRPYRTDLRPIDYFNVLKMQYCLRGQCFHKPEEVVKAYKSTIFATPTS